MLHQLEGLITRDDIADLAANEQLILDDNERISILESMRSIDVQACPGSGKTTLIAAKLILLAKKWPSQHQGICVLSHTNVAKDEIIDRLKQSKTIEAQRLLSYPHFIGTIQEFINRFLALPYLRSNGNRDITVDNDEYGKMARKLLNLNQFSWLRGTLNGLGDESAQDAFLRATFRFNSDDGTVINISRMPAAWRRGNSLQRARAALGQLKQYLDERGFFLFRDMYTHAQMAGLFNVELGSALTKRFPCVFLDEMQDTQKFQDELLREIFTLDDSCLIVQRFGDPDQAIFHGFRSEESNESFNGKSRDDMDFVIHKSHRFDGLLAEKIKSFSFNEIPLETELSEEAIAERLGAHATGDSFEHTIIIFDDDTRENVVGFFADIVSHQFSDEHKKSNNFCAKVVGAVGNKINPNADQLKIGHYWSTYDKAKSKPNFKEGSLIEAVRYCRQLPSIDWGGNYKLLINCILKLLRMADMRDEEGQYFSATSLRESFKDKGEWENFRKSIHLMLIGDYPIDQEFWDDICDVLTAIFEFENMSAEATQYMEFIAESIPEGMTIEEETGKDTSIVSLPDNKIKHSDGFLIGLSTIHGVKGETHDATLIVETKNYTFDLRTMMPYLTGELPNDDHPNLQLPDKPHATRGFAPNKVFMRQFYVAMSRPRHLLCLAVHSDRISDEQEQLLQEKGWRIERIPSPASAGIGV